MAKDVSDVVMGMLSTAGSATRPPQQAKPEPDPTPPSAAVTSRPAVISPDDGPVPAEPAAPAPQPTATAAAVAEAPRTLRLRPKTASLLREAWVEAKHDDVFLTAQDFASNLLEEALVSRRRRRAPRTA